MMRRRIRRLPAHILAVLLLALLVVRGWPHPPLSEGVPVSTAVLDRDGRLLRLTLASDDRYRQWLPLAQVSPTLVQAVLLHEDRAFHWHPGVNPWSLLRAFRSLLGGGVRVGGSTLTMQLARLRWRLDTRSASGKLVQIARALQLEAMYSKAAILEAYLNLAPYGGNIEGVGAAARIYFDQPASALSLPEALMLAVMPQSPGARGRWRRDAEGVAGPGPGLIAARDRLYRRWRDVHGGDAAQDARVALPLRVRPLDQLPFSAPHFVDRVLAAQRLHGPRPPDLPTPLDAAMQHLLEEQVSGYLRSRARAGLDNASVLLVDTRDMGVRALVGSADWHGTILHGQVNGTAAFRSPGSTLKPFLYALAIDQGLLHPATILRDVPTAFGAYTPENFDGRFSGPVSVTDALNRSRNIPAVDVAARLRSPDLHGLLHQAGVPRLRSREHYGLALVLGGGEVRGEDLARLYAMLAGRGRLRPLRFRETDPIERGTHLLSPEAAFITLDMLRQNPRPDAALASGLADLPVAWKTGTSWGFRDAWTVGVFGPYVLVVWVGHFDGRPNPSLVGVDAAAPLFFRLVDALVARGELGVPEPYDAGNARRVPVCLASGDLPNAWCPERRETWFIPGVSPIRLSTVHRAIQVDRLTGRAACGPFDSARMRIEVFEFWASDLMRVFAQAGLPRRRPPPGADCAGAAAWMGTPPRITSPLRGVGYRVRDDGNDRVGIALAATTDADAQQVYWFAGDAFLGSAAPGASLEWLPLQPGRYRLRAVDEHGRADDREVWVDFEGG